jgi:hypothetical protein
MLKQIREHPLLLTPIFIGGMAILGMLFIIGVASFDYEEGHEVFSAMVVGLDEVASQCEFEVIRNDNAIRLTFDVNGDCPWNLEEPENQQFHRSDRAFLWRRWSEYSHGDLQ